MPLSGGRYRVKTTPKGEKIRLHFTDSGVVNEARNMGTGAVHSPAEFKQDRKRRGDKLRKAMMGSSSHTSTAMR